VNENDVPQDESPTYGGRRRLLYAVNRDGAYVTVRSSGWDPESMATGAALEDIERRKDDAWRRAQGGATSPLEYYMFYRRMDLALLAQATGYSAWRVRRHFKPRVYARLNERVMARYAEALGIDAATLKTLVERP
jgi:hypothetical protein